MTQPIRQLLQPKYRADIDGLRAIAVLSVVCFHAFPNTFKSGFIGVDIFFVISGFLISTIIFENIAQGHFSFLQFYGRRIRRIFPALFTVLLFCLIFGWFALLTDEYKQLGSHTAGGAGFISNWLLWQESGYFDNASETKPLLHLWSLAIEEQFYIVWPLVLWFGFKYKVNWLVLCLGIAGFSFVLGMRALQTDVVSAFYAPQARAWELLIGAIAAYLMLYKAEWFEALNYKKRFLPNLLSVSGVILIILGLALISKGKSFPGLLALLPTVGTSLILLAGPHSWISQYVLPNRILVWVGLISFPLYLWHWPLLSFARIIESTTPSKEIRIAAVTLAIGLAWLTYRFIERPIRTRAVNTKSYLALPLLMLGIGLSGYAIYLNDGFAFRKHAALNTYQGDTEHAAFHRYVNDHYYPCAEKRIAAGSILFEKLVQCAQSKPQDPVEVVLLGDSHAEHLFLGLAEGLPNKNVAFYTRNSAPYLSNSEFSYIFEHVRTNPSIKQVVLTMWWIGRTTAATENEILNAARLLLNSGKEVFLTDDVPNFPFDPQKCKGKRWLSTTDATCSIKQQTMTHQPYVSMLHNLIKQEPRIKLIGTQKYLCDGKDCSMAREDKLLYRDFNHLNIYGSKYIGARLASDMSKP